MNLSDEMFMYKPPDPFEKAPSADIHKHKNEKANFDRIIETNRLLDVERTPAGLAQLSRCIANLKDLAHELEDRNKEVSLYRDYDFRFREEERKCKDLLLVLEMKQAEVEYELKYYALELSKQTLELGRQTLALSDKTVDLGNQTVVFSGNMNALTLDIRMLTRLVVWIALFQLVIGVATIIVQVIVK